MYAHMPYTYVCIFSPCQEKVSLGESKFIQSFNKHEHQLFTDAVLRPIYKSGFLLALLTFGAGSFSVVGLSWAL